MTPDETHAIVRAYHDGWVASDFESARRLLAPDLETDVPINAYASVEDWMAAVERTRAASQGVTLLAEFANENEALLLYDLELPPPIGTLRVAEHFTVADGQIRRIRHVHDTHLLRSAMVTSPAVQP